MPHSCDCTRYFFTIPCTQVLYVLVAVQYPCKNGLTTPICIPPPPQNVGGRTVKIDFSNPGWRLSNHHHPTVRWNNNRIFVVENKCACDSFLAYSVQTVLVTQSEQIPLRQSARQIRPGWLRVMIGPKTWLRPGHTDSPIQ